MKEKIKAKDVATALGISTATVSLAINGKAGVNEETRRRVLDYMGLSAGQKKTRQVEGTKRVRVISVFDESLGWDSMDYARGEMCREEVRRAFKDSGYVMDTIYYYRNTDSIDQILEGCVDEGIEGVIMNASYANREEVNSFVKSSIPMICCDFLYPEGGVDCIMMNNYAGVKKGLAYLFERKHRDILYFMTDYDIYNMHERRRAFCDFMVEKGLTDQPEQCMVELGICVAEIQRNMMHYIKNGGRLPTAIFAENYEVSIGVVRALENMGYRVPEDVSLVGFDQIPEVALLDIQVTTIQYHYERTMRLAAERLISRLKEWKEEHIQVFVDCELVEGNSVLDKRICT